MTPAVVCHLIERLDHGGAEMLVHSLATGMRGSAYRAIVCCLEGGAVASLLERDGIPVHCLNLRRRSILNPLSFVRFVARLVSGLRGVLETERVAIIHAHLPDPIIWGVCVGALTGTPVVGTYHGLVNFPQGRAAADPRNALRRALYRLSARRSACTIAVAPAIRDLLCRDIGFDERKTVLVMNGVDTERFARASPCSRTRRELRLEDRTIVTCVGRLVAGKGHRFLLEAMATVTRRDPRAALLVVGDGPERPALQQQARDLELAEHVRFAGDRTDVPALLAMTDVFVLPSLSEGIPVALIEAMAAGKPVVATRIPGNIEVVPDERFGLLVPPADSESIAAALDVLLRNPDRAAAIGARGQERARTHFDVVAWLAATRAVYDQVLAERRSARGGAA